MAPDQSAFYRLGVTAPCALHVLVAGDDESNASPRALHAVAGAGDRFARSFRRRRRRARAPTTRLRNATGPRYPGADSCGNNPKVGRLRDERALPNRHFSPLFYFQSARPRSQTPDRSRASLGRSCADFLLFPPPPPIGACGPSFGPGVFLGDSISGRGRLALGTFSRSSAG